MSSLYTDDTDVCCLIVIETRDNTNVLSVLVSSLQLLRLHLYSNECILHCIFTKFMISDARLF